MDAEYGEVETSGNIAGKSFYDFRLLDAVAGADNDTFRYGEITVPVGFVYTYNDGKGFHVRIPYTPDMRRLTVRLVMESGSGGTEYLRNPGDGQTLVSRRGGDGSRHGRYRPGRIFLPQ